MVFLQLLDSLPEPALIALVVGVTTLLVVGAVFLVRRMVGVQALQANNDFQVIAAGFIGAFYAVLIAFVISVIWDQFGRTADLVETEANKVGDLLRNAQGYPDPFRRQVQTELRDYAQAVVDEWESVAQGGQGTRQRDAFDTLSLTYISYSPTDARQTALYSEGLTRLTELGEERQLRLLRVNESIPASFWFVLLFGGAVSIASTLFFGLRDLRSQLALTAMVSALIALSLVVIYDFDTPFTGAIGVAPAAFTTQIDEANRFLQ